MSQYDNDAARCVLSLLLAVACNGPLPGSPFIDKRIRSSEQNNTPATIYQLRADWLTSILMTFWKLRRIKYGNLNCCPKKTIKSRDYFRYREEDNTSKDMLSANKKIQSNKIRIFRGED